MRFTRPAEALKKTKKSREKEEDQIFLFLSTLPTFCQPIEDRGTDNS